LLGGEIVDRDIGSFTGVSDGGRPSHPGVASGYERLASLKAAGSTVAGLTMIGHRIHLARKSRPGLGLFLERRLRIRRGWIVELGACHRLTSLFSRCRSSRKRHHAEPGAANHVSTRHSVLL